MIFILYLALVACQVFSAPANSSHSQIPAYQKRNATDTGSSSLSTDSSGIAPITSTIFVPSTPSLSPTETASSQVTQSNDSLSTVSSNPTLSIISTIVPSSDWFTPSPTSTIFVTDVVTDFEATTVDPTSSSSSIVTVVVTETTTTIITATPSPSWDDRTLWAVPPQMTDLSAFNVTYFPSGQRNLHIVAQIPAKAFAPTAKPRQDTLFPFPNTTSPSTALQLVYPAHSVNPGSKPEGGADFYASPLNLAGARNVTLDYSVFFPAGFDWVKGGKLPGLFGGHTGCSGGASARDCFSTRLMWRPHGIGELYLYAPKDKQSNALCADLQSVCDTTYGFSIGRGSFTFAAGDWTHLSQSVVLNTPGRNDGEFVLVVDGRRVIDRRDMFYRDVALLDGKTKSAAQPAEFLGLFFSTFFGGHGEDYATPKQQYAWFKDFAITRHD